MITRPRKRRSTVFFFPIGMIALAVIPAMFAWHFQNSPQSRTTYAIDFRIEDPHHEEWMEYTLLNYEPQFRFQSFRMTSADFGKSGRIRQLEDLCSGIYAGKDTATLIKVRVSRECTYSNFIEVIDCFQTHKLHYRLLNLNLYAGYSEKVVTFLEFPPYVINLRPPKPGLFQKMLSRYEPVCSALRTRPELYSMLFLWEILVVLNISRLVRHTQQRFA